MENQVVILKLTPAGAELMIAALRKLPHEQVHDLVQQTWEQYQAEIKRLQAHPPVEQVEAEAE